jgi:subfamily B ATP-binding cassette protein MsbA
MPPAANSSSKNKESQSSISGWSVYKRLLSYSGSYWKIFLIAIVGMIVIAISELSFAKFVEPMLDGTFGKKDPVIILWVPIVLMVIYAVRVFGNFMSSYFMAVIARGVIRKLRTKAFDRYLTLPVSFFDTTSTGVLVSKMVYDVEQLADAASSVVTILIRNSLIIVALLAFMFYNNAKLAALLFISIPFLLVIVLYVSKRFRLISRRIQNSMGDVSSITEEILEANREVKIFGGQKYEGSRFEAINYNNWKQFLKYHATTALSSPVIEFIVATAFAGILYYVTQPEMIEQMTSGKFMSFLTAMLLLLQAARPLANINAQLQRGIAAAQSVFELLDTEGEKDTGKQLLERVKGEIEYRNVSFAYQNDRTVLRNINLTIHAGESIALVGRSGSGKTTLVNLLPRFYELSSGAIYIDDHDISEICLDSLRSHVALVSQHVTLFNDTIAHNIAYGDLENASLDDIRRAAEAAHALEFIEQLPQGFDTLVGENGVLLSGGQRQRLAIARAILKDAPILILDEATSALDTESERHIQAAMDEVMKDRTTLVIAHRLSTIERVDKIVVMENGVIVESGKHEELLAKQGAYQKLHKLQFSNS